MLLKVIKRFCPLQGQSRQLYTFHERCGNDVGYVAFLVQHDAVFDQQLIINKRNLEGKSLFTFKNIDDRKKIEANAGNETFQNGICIIECNRLRNYRVYITLIDLNLSFHSSVQLVI